MKLFSLSAALILTLSVGCSGPDVELVTGSVLLDGRAEVDISVTLWPMDDLCNGALIAHQVKEDGSFEIVPSPEQGQKGIVGQYTVLFYDYHFPPRFDATYWDPARTPFKVDIGKGVTNLDTLRIDCTVQKKLHEQAFMKLMGQRPNIPMP